MTKAREHTTTRLAVRAVIEGIDGGRPARAELFERVMTRIHRYFVGLVWNPQDVEDCLQRTLLLLERSLREGTYDHRRSFNRWMWMKAHRVYVDHCRRHARGPRRAPPASEEAAAAPDGGAGIAQVDARIDAATVLHRLREELDPEALAIFLLHHDEGHPLADIAAIVSRDRKTVRRRLDEATRRAQRILEGSPRP